MTLGSYIKEIRERKNLKQTQLAAKAGLSRTFITRLEGNSFKTIDIETAKALALALDVPVEDILNAQGLSVTGAKVPSVGTVIAELTSRLPTEIPIYNNLEEDKIGYIYLYIDGHYNKLKALTVDNITERPAEIIDGSIVVIDTISKPVGGDMVVIEQNNKYEIIKLDKDQAARLNPAIFRGTVLLSLSHYKDKVKFYLS